MARLRKGSIAPKTVAQQDEKILPWSTITRKQADQFIQITKVGTWTSIAVLVLFWISIRFVAPALGLWTPADQP